MQGRSITIEDINQLLDVVVDKKKRIIYQKGYKENINKNRKFLKEYFLDEEFYTPESYLEGKRVREKIIETYYFYDSESIIGKKVEKEIIFKEVTYFLASLGVRIEHNYVASFGFGAVYPPTALTLK